MMPTTTTILMKKRKTLEMNLITSSRNRPEDASERKAAVIRQEASQKIQGVKGVDEKDHRSPRQTFPCRLSLEHPLLLLLLDIIIAAVRQLLGLGLGAEPRNQMIHMLRSIQGHLTSPRWEVELEIPG
jgi:hypothetical protein